MNGLNGQNCHDCSMERLGERLPLSAAISALTKRALETQLLAREQQRHGHMRLEVTLDEEELPGSACPLAWLRAQSSMRVPKVYLRSRDRDMTIAGLEEAHAITGASLALNADPSPVPLPHPPQGMIYIGGYRFNECVQAERADQPNGDYGSEWDGFGSYRFVIPLVEVKYSKGELVMALNLWDDGDSFKGTAILCNELLLSMKACFSGGATSAPVVLPSPSYQEDTVSRAEWDSSIEHALSRIREGVCTKVVVARTREYRFTTGLDPIDMLCRLEEQRGCLFCLMGTDGSAFVGCTPERLFRLKDGVIRSEALAGTRERGATPEADELLGRELMESEKDKSENAITALYLSEAFKGFGRVTVSEPYISKQAHVQHICRDVKVSLETDADEARLLHALHPTPAVCGAPRKEAHMVIRECESFDRGLYAGPIGYIASNDCEFCVGIRSALICQSGRKLIAYAGCGIVPGSTPEGEWQETGLGAKLKTFALLFPPRLDLKAEPTLNSLWGTLLVEELARQGVNHFCCCPGSRSTPLTVAAVKHPLASTIVHHDERGAGFYGLGYAKATNRPCAIITSSGTAVANLLPAVVEACHGAVPLLLLTADRPSELRDTGSNQTIDQVKMFGGYVKWFKDMASPSDQIPATALLSDIGYAVQQALGLRGNSLQPGPVHVNCMFRENLAPEAGPVREAELSVEGSTSDWAQPCLEKARMGQWVGSGRPLCSTLHQLGMEEQGVDEVASLVFEAKRGILVVGGLASAAERAAVRHLAGLLGWPVMADVGSGLRSEEFTATGERIKGTNQLMVKHYDQMLLEPLVTAGARPDMVLQLGSPLVSRRLVRFLHTTAITLCSYIQVVNGGARHDPSASATHVVCGEIRSFASRLAATLGRPIGTNRKRAGNDLKGCLPVLSDVAAAVLEEAVAPSLNELTEPLIAHLVSKSLPERAGLLLSNSMPCRDMDCFGSVRTSSQRRRNLAKVAINRGASGIDGIVSSAIGYAVGLGEPVTALIGDLAGLHDLNALHLLRLVEVPITLVCVNNGGGGIFSFLPIAKHTSVFTPYFTTPHDLSFKGACEMFGVHYAVATSASEFREAYEASQRSGRHTFIEAQVPDKEKNVTVHRQLGSTVRKSLSQEICKGVELGWERLPALSTGTSMGTVVMLHGFMGSRGDWYEVAKDICEGGYSCILVDLPGHGTSIASGPGEALLYSMEAAVRLLKELLQSLEISKCMLVGYSMGARVAMLLAKECPSLVSHLICLGGCPGLESYCDRAERWGSDQATAQELQSPLLECFLHRWYSAGLWGGLRARAPAVYSGMVKKRLHANKSPEILARSLLGMSVALQPNLWPFMATAVASPTILKVLYMSGGLDTKATAFSQRLASVCTSAVVVLKGRGHALPTEAPHDVAGAILQFLQRDDGNGICTNCSTPRASSLQAANSNRTNGSSHSSRSVRISSNLVKQFDLPLTTPLRLARSMLTSRSGLLVVLRSSGGGLGVGEVSPLPGFHSETLQEAHQQLTIATQQLEGRDISQSLAEMLEPGSTWITQKVGIGELLPSVRCGLEMAVLHMLANDQGQSLGNAIAAAGGLCFIQSIRVNSLLTAGESFGGDNRSQQGGDSVIKIKVGGDTAADAAKVNATLSSLQEGTRLRLDANQQWSMEQALAFCSQLEQPQRLEYIEEPIDDPTRLPEFYKRSGGIPYALDESLSAGIWGGRSGLALSGAHGAAALVLKPALLGGMVRCISLWREAALTNMCREATESSPSLCCVVTSCFDSTVGLAHAAILAGLIGHGSHHGLSTYAWLKGDVVEEGAGFSSAVSEEVEVVNLERCQRILNEIASTYASKQ